MSRRLRRARAGRLVRICIRGWAQYVRRRSAYECKPRGTHLPFEVGDAVSLFRPELEVARAPLAVAFRSSSSPDVGRRGDDAALEKADRHLAALLPLRPRGVLAPERAIALLALGFGGLNRARQRLAFGKGRQAGSARSRRALEARASTRLLFCARVEAADRRRRLRRVGRRSVRDGQEGRRRHRYRLGRP